MTCDVSTCPHEATVEVRFPHSGTYRYCHRHGNPWREYATPIRRPA